MTINIPASDKKRIVIVGGGFAGLTLARKLSNKNFQIVLIDKNNYHQFQPLFYQVAMSGLEPSSIVFPLRKLFQNQKDVFIRMAEVQSIDTSIHTIYTNIGDLQYDYLVLALGAETNFFGNEQIAGRAIPMKSVAEALYLRNRILNDYEKALTTSDNDERQGLLDIVVVGGGPTGVEVAGSLAEMKKFILPKDYPELNVNEVAIHLIEGAPRVLSTMSEQASAKAHRFLSELDVKVKLNTFVTDFDGKWILMNDGTKLRANKVIWAAGVRGSKIEGLSKDLIAPGNRIKVNRFNQVEGYHNIFAIGDVAFMIEEKYPKGQPQVAQVAIQHATHLVKNLKLLQKGQTLKPFSYYDKGSMATIGRHLAVVDLPYWRFQGAFAWFVWMFVHLFTLLGVKNKLFVFINWVWNYFTYDQSLRLIIRPKVPKALSERTPAVEEVIQH
ncbi:MAG: NAD(P)/FAD-dependent oxidoreductase [Saprospiraceae bacterium]|nr:NAD(P)/FAD-dependent oxidoreductase [Saprospiraceae bacterium]